MKFLTIALLAVCLIQGNSAQFSALRSLVSNAASDTASAASSATEATQSTASDVVFIARKTADNIRNSLSGAAQSVIDSATSGVSRDDLTQLAATLSADELLEVIQVAAAEATNSVAGAQDLLSSTINSISEKADTAVSALNVTSGLTKRVKAVVERATEAGVDVTDCTDELAEQRVEGNSVVVDVVRCVSEKVNEAVTLVRNIANVPSRAATLVKDGAVTYATCNTMTNAIARRTCEVMNIAPIATESTLLLKDTVQYASQTTILVTTLQSQLTVCAATAVSESTIQAAVDAAKIVQCVYAKQFGQQHSKTKY